jgi:dipeptidyl aminopeptidase/acylaminoacyl peptidase
MVAPEAYFDVERLAGFAVDPAGDRVAYISDAGGTFRLWLRSLDRNGSPTCLWDAAAAPAGSVWRPDGRRILVRADLDGSENNQLVEVDVSSGALDWLTDLPDVRHEIGVPYGSGTHPYSPDSTLLGYASNRRDRSVFDVLVRDLRTGEDRTILAGEDRYFPVCWSPDGRRLVILRAHQVSEHDLFVHDLAAGQTRHVTPHDGPATYRPIGWSVDGRGIYLLTNEDRPVSGLAYLDLVESRLDWIATPDHDIDAAAVSADGRRMVWARNVDGFSTLVVRYGGKANSIDVLPVGAVAKPDGLDGHSIALTPDCTRLVCMLSRATRPTDLYVLDLDAPDRPRAERLTGFGDPVPAGTEPDVVRIPSTDGVTVSALQFRPPGAGVQAPCPVVIAIHGGPEDQEFPHWEWTSGLYQYLLHNGIGVLAPNIRGSTGYGKTHQRLIYRSWGDGDLRDIAACVEFCRQADWIDGDRLGVFGASYGGFAVLSSLSRLPQAWAVGVNVFGPSDLPAFARTVPPHWRRRVREWIGDPDDDAAMLANRSPLTYVDQIRAPLLTVQGAQDTRVVKPAADRLVARLRELGRDVEYLVLPDDGHGFGTRETYVAVMSACADWLIRHLR